MLLLNQRRCTTLLETNVQPAVSLWWKMCALYDRLGLRVAVAVSYMVLIIGLMIPSSDFSLKQVEECGQLAVTIIIISSVSWAGQRRT